MTLNPVFRRLLKKISNSRLNTKGYYYGLFHHVGSGVTLEGRWFDIMQIVDLRATDRVLDVGCAEGLIAFEIAKHVAHVDGIDVMPHRVERARQEAIERKVPNVSFVHGSITQHRLEPMSYDVVLALSVIGKGVMVVQDSKVISMPKKVRSGFDELACLLAATRRQIILRVNVQEYKPSFISLHDILQKMNECGFDGVCFSRSRKLANVIVGNRRGTDARLLTVPPLVLVPAEDMRDYPCLRDARIGSPEDFA
jgi:SAM-dependent methyltransferase